MPRTRYIRPGFFENEELAEQSHQTRLFFIGLWTLADREGYVEYRPKRLKRNIFPYENCDIDGMVGELVAIDKLEVVEIEGTKLLKVSKWHEHQNIHHKETPSKWSNAENPINIGVPDNPVQAEVEPGPVPCQHGVSTVQARTRSPLDLDSDLDLNLDSSLDAKPDGTATKLNLFLKKLGKAGLHVPKAPFWLLTAMSNGRADTYLKAAEELQYTKFMEGDKPATIDNFKEKSFGWVQQLASGKWSVGGPPPQAAPVDPSQVKRTVPWCEGKRLTPAEEEAAKTHPDTKHLWEHYQRKHKRNLDRDAHRGDTPSEDAPVHATIPRPTLKTVDEDFDTAAAQRRALEQIAAFEKANN